jgi:hypothetical protein
MLAVFFSILLDETCAFKIIRHQDKKTFPPQRARITSRTLLSGQLRGSQMLVSYGSNFSLVFPDYVKKLLPIDGSNPITLESEEKTVTLRSPQQI